MRNESLVGYLLHQRSYKEKRALYYLFSQEHGIVHGIGKKGAPLFAPLQLFANGKRDLKTFSQINITPITTQELDGAHKENIQRDTSQINSDSKESEQISYKSIDGQQQYAALYLNEILWKLLPTEDPLPVLWWHYQNSLQQLKKPLTAIELRLCLRQFERYLFAELGFSLMLTHDSFEVAIDSNAQYRFVPDVGLTPIYSDDDSVNVTAQAIFEGTDILKMLEQGISNDTLNLWSRLHRQLIDHLLDYQPLQSRLLWQQQQRYR